MIRVDLSYAGFERLCAYIEHSYASDEDRGHRPLGRGLYGDSRFYLSRERYHAFNTCNVWSARALRDAGCPITPAATITVEQLMSRVARFGTAIQRRPAPRDESR